MQRTADFSPDRVYRYTLRIIWIARKEYVNFCCLNPSTADENNNDPTVRRCIGFAESWGYGGMVMTNLFAYRATDPGVMKLADNPVGPDNNHWIEKESSGAGLTIAAWGTHGKYMGRDLHVLRTLLTRPHYLSLNQNTTPQHPLYLKKTLTPIKFP